TCVESRAEAVSYPRQAKCPFLYVQASSEDHRHHRLDPRGSTPRGQAEADRADLQVLVRDRRPEKQVVAGLTEIDSDVTMEYGLTRPPPGGETEWLAPSAAALDGIEGTGL